MKRSLGWMLGLLVCVALVACAPQGGSSLPTSSGTPVPTPMGTPVPTPTPYPTPYPAQNPIQVHVLMHLWYTYGGDHCPTTGIPADYWLPWVWWPAKIDDPCNIIPGTNWMREISSGSYPLTGPYYSGNEDIMRWQIRSAKAGGIDSFTVSVYSWVPYLDRIRGLFFGDANNKGLLRIASEENFHVSIEGWGVPDPNDQPYWGPIWKNEMARFIQLIETSPYHDAYLHIDGKPVLWVFYPTWMSDQEQLEFFDGTDANPRNITWVLRCGWVEKVAELNSKLKRSKVQYLSWNAFPTENDWSYNPNLGYDLQRMRDPKSPYPSLGLIPMSHTYGGFDERPGKASRVAPNPRYGFRRGTSLLDNFFQQSEANGAQHIWIESWNEWAEGSHLEPGLNITPYRDMGQERTLYLDGEGHEDPHLYLKAIARFKRMAQWVDPQPPPCSAFDPIIRNRSLPIQCTGGGSLGYRSQEAEPMPLTSLNSQERAELQRFMEGVRSFKRMDASALH